MNDQRDYWNRVAWAKTFTHPLKPRLLSKYVSRLNRIVDYGCGYGRLVKELIDLGYKNIRGYDVSDELIRRGRQDMTLPLFHVDHVNDLPEENNSLDCILLFAVLTCIPSNAMQQELINSLHAKLKPGGIIYISDYYLQENLSEVSQYACYENDPKNFGVFTLTEGVMFRHHTREWIRDLTREFSLIKELNIRVKTMNGVDAKAFQLIAQKQV